MTKEFQSGDLVYHSEIREYGHVIGPRMEGDCFVCDVSFDSGICASVLPQDLRLVSRPPDLPSEEVLRDRVRKCVRH